MLALLTAIAFAGDTFVFLASDNLINQDGVSPNFVVYTETPFAKHWSFSTYSGVGVTYSQAYIGPVWKPNDDLSLGVSGGLESAPTLWRVAASALYIKKGFQGLLILEHGGTGPWYRVDLTEKVGIVRFGFLARRYNGIGGRIGVVTDHFEALVAPLYDLEADRPNLLVVLSWTP